MSYPFSEIEKKWQKFWVENKTYKSDLENREKKLYSLVMLPYPSGDKLHIGHWYNFAPADTWTRFKKLQGFNVFEPIGFDAFGLPAENYAVKTGVHPYDSTSKNISNIREQLKNFGAMYDLEHEINSSQENYYKWTQWIFLLLYKNGLAYRANAPVNWCPSCNTVLANEQVVDGECERCGATVSKRDMIQWFFKITKYAQELLDSLDILDWPEKTITMQKNWIGRSAGIEADFKLKNSEEKIKIFTTRPDTIFGATYMVLSPEHPLTLKISIKEKLTEVENYIRASKNINEIERTSLVREKTGVFTGAFAINPLTKKEIPIWVSDFVLITYGTGALMAVPAHDERDFEFAKKFKLEIKKVILKEDEKVDDEIISPFCEEGVLVNSENYSGLNSKIAFEKICDFLESQNIGKRKINFRLRDWLVSRQRYWGSPIPIIYCGNCGEVPVPEKELPLKLPYNVDFKPTGESPLARCDEFVNTTCPKCGKSAKREVDTMDTFVCSSWYYFRYLDPKNDDKIFDSEKINKWMPVDKYIGGAEHTVLHLLYSRFFTKVFRDVGLVKIDEPFKSLRHQGTITNQGAKMSKSKGNVVSPETYTSQYGGDTFRMFLMFMGPYEDGGDWNDKGILGIFRFLNRVYEYVLKNKNRIVKNIEFNKDTINQYELKLYQKLNQTIKKVTLNLDELKFNTAISALMELLNLFTEVTENVSNEVYTFTVKNYIKMLSPFAPHLSEELWEVVGEANSIFIINNWMDYDKNAIVEIETTVVVQINGKIRSKLIVPINTTEVELKKLAHCDEKVKKYIDGKEILKEIIVKNKLVNFVVK